MNEYLTKKIGEEASEVAQAAFKVLLHKDRPARRVLISEMSDMQAMLIIACRKMDAAQAKKFSKMIDARIAREEKKGRVNE